MKGRNRNASEKRYHDLLCSVVGCIACRKTGDYTNYVSVHHIDGRTKPNAHWLVIPLCAHHHQDLGFSSDFIPVHPYKTRFEAAYGKQIDLVRECVELLLEGGFIVPGAALHALGMKKECQAPMSVDTDVAHAAMER